MAHVTCYDHNNKPYKYLIRGNWTPGQLRKQFAAYCLKYGWDKITYRRWLIQNGKVYVRVS